MNFVFISIFHLPVAAVGDLLGIIVFVLYAVIYMFTKRVKEGQDAGESEGPTSLPPSSLPPQMPPVAADLDEKIRQYRERLERRRKESSQPRQRAISTKPKPPPLSPAPPTAQKTSKSLRVPELVPEAHEVFPVSVPTPAISPIESKIDEIGMKGVFAEVGMLSAEDAYQELAPGEKVAESPQVQAMRKMLKSPTTLKQVVLLTEVLGQPKALVG
jgi:hypothetical protein